MTSVKEYIENKFETLQKTFFEKSERPIGIQLLGNDPLLFERCAEELNSLNPDVVNVNLGCPSENVIKAGSGASLLKDGKKIFQILSILRKKLSRNILVSAKIRLGFDEKNFIADQIIKICEDANIDFVVVHLRFVKDDYSTGARWEYIDKLKKSSSLPLVANGSIFSAEDAIKMLDVYDVDAIMIARGAIGNPLIFKEIEQAYSGENDFYKNKDQEVINQVIKHLEYSKQFYGDYQGAINFRKHFLWYFRYSDNFEELRSEIYEATECEQIKELAIRNTEKLLNIKPEIKLNIDEKFRKKILFWLE